MSDLQGSLTIRFQSPYGKTYSMSVPISHDVATDIERIKPPGELGPPGVVSFDDVVEVIKTREFRKDLFVREATRLGYLLAERMQDAEGWHDYSRIEPAKRQLQESKE